MSEPPHISETSSVFYYHSRTQEQTDRKQIIQMKPYVCTSGAYMGEERNQYFKHE